MSKNSSSGVFCPEKSTSIDDVVDSTMGSAPNKTSKIREIIRYVKDPYTGVQLLGTTIEWSSRMYMSAYLFNGSDGIFKDNLLEQALLMTMGWTIFEAVTAAGHLIMYKRKNRGTEGFWRTRVNLQKQHYKAKIPLTCLSVALVASMETLGVPRMLAQNLGGKPSGAIQTLYTTYNKQLQDYGKALGRGVIDKPYAFLSQLVTSPFKHLARRKEERRLYSGQ